MASSGTYDFNLPIDDIIRQSYSRIGIGSPTGDEMRQARMSLNLLLQEIGSRAVFLFATEQESFSTQPNVGDYLLPVDVLDVQDVVCGDAGFDISMHPYGQQEYQRLPYKQMSGRPVQYYSDRGRDRVTLRLWPVPNRVYTISYYKVRKLQDVGAYTNNLDIPIKYLPAVVSGLAWSIADQKFAAAPQELNAAMRETERMRRDQLKLRYEEELNRAIDEDRDRTSLFILPDFERRR